MNAGEWLLAGLVWALVLLASAVAMLTRIIWKLIPRPARRLNLTIERKSMDPIQVGQSVLARIAPNGDGKVTDVVFDVAPGDAYTMQPQPDGLSCIYTAQKEGTGFIAEVRAKNSAGADLSDQAPLPDVVPVVTPADKLNLTIEALPTPTP